MMKFTLFLAFITPIVTVVLYVLLIYALILVIKALQLYIRKNS